MPNKGHQVSQTFAAEQARKKSAELSKVGVLSMSLVINNGESSPELSGEDEFAQWCWQVLKRVRKRVKKKVQEKVQKEGLKKVQIKLMSLFKVLKKVPKKVFFLRKVQKRAL